MASAIEWTDEVWNPITGCSKISEGCRHCYAERIAKRFWKDRAFTDVQLHRDRLDKPLRWKRPRMVFVNSMSDLFHKDVPDEFISKVFDVINRAPQHIFQILTKRPGRMREFMRDRNPTNDDRYGPSNGWLGVSVENQLAANRRIPWLQETPAALRFLSCEPLIQRVDLTRAMLEGIGWVIVGGESGPGARPMKPEWALNILSQCRKHGVPYFFKQGSAANWGARKFKDFETFPPDLQVRETPKPNQDNDQCNSQHSSTTQRSMKFGGGDS